MADRVDLDALDEMALRYLRLVDAGHAGQACHVAIALVEQVPALLAELRGLRAYRERRCGTRRNFSP